MKKFKYLLICCFVIMGLLTGVYIQNVDAYQVSPNQEAKQVQATNFICQTSSTCSMGHKDCDETHTQTCLLGHVNCQTNHNAQNNQSHHQKQSQHNNHTQHHH
ncbi:hypothetical protein [Candidatus Stoquefichus massiliensis]|uniref:hypothetical protein n=1 Tax=Candidatus Stoquefichus massiliensis TaxID=1470350 RepID=UPI000480163F|nr:hypothetical protein [Candidatus Stoquefichus massiliensis]